MKEPVDILVELGLVKQRYKAVLEVLNDGASVTEVARRYEVGRQTVHNGLRRYAVQRLGGLVDKSSRPYTYPHPSTGTEEGLVQRSSPWTGPMLWLTDITKYPTGEGKVYCCVVLDAYSRRVLGWAIDRRCETPLVNDAVSMASAARPTGPRSVIDSDHNSQTGLNRSNQPPAC